MAGEERQNLQPKAAAGVLFLIASIPPGMLARIRDVLWRDCDNKQRYPWNPAPVLAVDASLPCDFAGVLGGRAALIDGKQLAAVCRIKALWRLHCCALTVSAAEGRRA